MTAREQKPFATSSHCNEKNEKREDEFVDSESKDPGGHRQYAMYEGEVARAARSTEHGIDSEEVHRGLQYRYLLEQVKGAWQ
jgi:hypothetical protein